ncbi:excalibur calcium-binding domain-containing protein [Cryobacterium sp. 1639]|uniref:CAP domain-containing protein n=1 Tax=Cryobacterium inferilacus TaxID=2866629 RepID=UPI001C7300AC|nr:CAP domain-containing protein [Cryobacterium sp. 1639]MBX0301957.1 excalibur calcium-binding domain-containing protein [Cryobacterium sp. 1639]
MLALFTAVILTLGLSLAAPTVSANAAASDIATILQQTNAARAKQGLPALKSNAAMNKVAQAWAAKMATDGYRHNPAYSTQIPTGWNSASENIAWNYTSSTVVAAWINSPGHYANIMRAGTDIGIGYYDDPDGGGRFFVQNFANYPAFTAAPTPKVAGTPRVGSTLTATPGTWSPAPDMLAYQWKRGGVAIPRATAKSYTVTAADVGTTLTFTVTVLKVGLPAVTKTSSATAKVTGRLTAAPVPRISGTVRVGQTLTATAGTWSPAPVALSYQWKRAGVAIIGATARTYVVRPTDADASVTVTVTGKKSGYSAVTRQSTSSVKAVGLVYRTCALLNAQYPHGVVKAGVTRDTVKGVKRAFTGAPYVSTALYLLNKSRDGDTDGIACE